jgi:hypothetical protein
MHGGNDSIGPGIYAIVESAEYLEDDNQNNLSSIFTPIRKKVVFTDGFVRKSVLYLADVEAFVAPIAVIPDIGGDKNAYFVVKNKTQWRENFLEWLDEPIVDDAIDSDVDDGSDFEYEAEDSEEEEGDDIGFYEFFRDIMEEDESVASTCSSSSADSNDSDSSDSDSESSGSSSDDNDSESED